MSTEKIMEQAQVFASAWSVVGGPFDDGEAMDVAAQEKDELRRMVAELVAERDALAARLAELEGKEPVGEIIHSDVLPGADGAYRHELLCDFRLGVQTELYARPVPAEMSPEFTDTARSALLWVLWHHQGGSCPVGQPIRYALGMGAHERLSDYQVQEAKTWAELTNSETRDFHRRPAEPVNARLLDALKLAECVYRKNVVNEGEPSSVLEAMQAAITAAEAQRPTDYSSTVDRAWARFCGAFGDGPDAPYPGMIASFENHYGQSFRDKEWRTEASCWAAAWHKATELATKTNPQAKEIEMTDEQKKMAYYKAGMLEKAPPFVPARVRVLKEQFGDGPFRGAGVPAGEHDCRCNKWGAVSVSARDGKLLGLRLDEFEPVAWRENAPPAETCNDQTCGD